VDTLKQTEVKPPKRIKRSEVRFSFTTSKELARRIELNRNRQPTYTPTSMHLRRLIEDGLAQDE
jgi:hypothetical protein